jgi:hypothetical protein
MSEHANLAAALAAFQAELPVLGKDSTANAGTYSYEYADLAAVSRVVLPLLGKHGLSFSSKPTVLDGKFCLAYTLSHAQGDTDQGIYPLPATGKAQEIGSAITYARRYALMAITGVFPGGEDDDGKGAPEIREHWQEPAPVPNPEQVEAYEETLRLIKNGNSESAVMEMGARVKTFLAEGRLTQNQYDHLSRFAARRLAEFKGATGE